MHYGDLLSSFFFSFSLFLSLSLSLHLCFTILFSTIVLAHHVVLPSLDLLSILATLQRQKRLAVGTRRRITGHVVIIRHCRVMIRECARPLLYTFFLPFPPLPLKGPTKVVDGLNHRRSSRRGNHCAAAWKDRQFAINSSLRETKMRSPTMARSVAASNNRPNYTFSFSLFLSFPVYPMANDVGLCCWSAGKYTESWRRRRERKRGKEKERKKVRRTRRK